MKSKLNLLTQSIASCCYDIVSLVETNLSSDVNDSELGFSGFSIFRCDRNHMASGKLSGGGALIAVRNNIPCHKIVTPDLNTECVFVSCNVHTVRLLVVCVYIPPNQPAAVYSTFCETFEDVLFSNVKHDQIILLGDFNLPNIDWMTTGGFDLSDSARQLFDLATTHKLRQLNHIQNYRGVSLDLIFSTLVSIVITHAEDVLLAEDRHHPAIGFSFELDHSYKPSSHKYILDFRNCSLDEVLSRVQNMPYPSCDNLAGAEATFNFFSDQLASIVRANTPIRRVGASHFPVWFSSHLRHLVIRKKILHKKFKASSSFTDYQRFCEVRSECKRLARDCHQTYINRIEDDLPNNLKSFWSHVSSLKRTSNIPQKMYLDDAEATDAPSKCELFARFFSSVFNVADIPLPDFDYGLNHSVSDCTVSAVDICNKLEALDVRKGAGPDDIPPIVLKYCAPVLAPYLTILFKALLSGGIFPSSLKVSFVVPIFKQGDKNNVRNYRPIAIQSTIAKVFESIVQEFLYFNFNRLIIKEQHGFMQGRSTITNLLHFQEFIMTSFTASCSVDCAYLDFAKAFDKVNILILMAKLKAYGISGPLLSWLGSYLTGRSLMVKCDGASSLPFPVLSGVPQGSHLGPLLFLLFINDIGNDICAEFLLFADDVKLFNRISSTQSQTSLQQALDNISQWCTINSMELNVSKCQVITFKRGSFADIANYRINGIGLRRVDSVNDLGVIMTSTLSPLEHLLSVSSRASSLLGFIMRSTRGFQSPHSIVILYKSLVRPVLEYGSVIWSPHLIGHIEILNKIQLRFVRMLGTRLGYTFLGTPVEDVMLHFDLQPLPLRRQFFDLILLFKLVNGLLDCPDLLSIIDLVVPRGNRSRTVFRRRFQPTYYAYNSGLARILRLGGVAATRVDFFGVSTQSFRRAIIACLADQF